MSAARQRALVYNCSVTALKKGQSLLFLQESVIMAKVILIAGLPGSGKTEYGKTLEQQGIWFISDFNKDAINDDFRFPYSQHYGELIRRLQAGETCAIADIDFCRQEAQQEAEACIRAMVKDVEIEWRCFENDPQKCLENARRRNRPTFAAEEEKIRRYSHDYKILPHQKIFPIFDPKMAPTEPRPSWDKSINWDAVNKDQLADHAGKEKLNSTQNEK
jgi:hypothetical protein